MALLKKNKYVAPKIAFRFVITVRIIGASVNALILSTPFSDVKSNVVDFHFKALSSRTDIVFFYRDKRGVATGAAAGCAATRQ